MRTTIAILVLLTLTGLVSAQEQRPPGRLHGEHVAVSLIRWTTNADGAKRKTGSADTTLRVGQHASLYASTGFTDSSGTIVDRLCSNSIGTGGDRASLAGESVHLWWVDVQVIEAATQRIELALEWARHDLDDVGASSIVREGQRNIVVEEGAVHVVDFLEPTASEEDRERCGLNVVYEIQARVLEDPKLADTELQYFFWTQDLSNGKQRTQTFYAKGMQGELVHLEPASIRWPIEEATPDGQLGEVVAEIRGSLLGRVRVDGSIDLYVRASRQVGVARPGESARGGVGGGGLRMLNIRPGELIELVMPTPQGGHTERLDPASGFTSTFLETSPRGVSVAENTVRVDFERFFAGKRMSIFVTAKVADE